MKCYRFRVNDEGFLDRGLGQSRFMNRPKRTAKGSCDAVHRPRDLVTPWQKGGRNWKETGDVGDGGHAKRNAPTMLENESRHDFI